LGLDPNQVLRRLAYHRRQATVPTARRFYILQKRQEGGIVAASHAQKAADLLHAYFV
jgi:hypothetical protein